MSNVISFRKNVRSSFATKESVLERAIQEIEEAQFLRRSGQIGYDAYRMAIAAVISKARREYA